jgi:hypothetical protein
MWSDDDDDVMWCGVLCDGCERKCSHNKQLSIRPGQSQNKLNHTTLIGLALVHLNCTSRIECLLFVDSSLGVASVRA